MTADDRLEALAFLGLNDRQTRFVATVALHSGFCLRRQYQTFAGVGYGKNVRDFLDGLVMRGWAVRFTYRADRGHVYHLHARAIYRALHQDDNRNRRVASPALIARKLMLLDCVLLEPDIDWVATEADKVTLFTDRYGVNLGELPQQTFPGDDDALGTTRYFIDKLPIGIVPSSGVPQFVYLATDSSPRSFAHFLSAHRALFARLPAWSVVCVAPSSVTDVSAYESTFADFAQGGAVAQAERLRRLFATRRLIDTRQLGDVSVDDLHAFRRSRRLFATSRVERLYEAWLTNGDAAFREASTEALGNGRLEMRRLPYAYEQFGTMAGVA